MAKYKRKQRGYFIQPNGVKIEVEIIKQSPVSGGLSVFAVEQEERGTFIIMPYEFEAKE